MTKLFLGLFCTVLFFSNSMAQDTTVTYYDKDWKETTSEDYTYYGKLFQDSEVVWVKNDFYRNGQIQMIGHYKTEEAKESYGLLIYFHENGDTSSIKDFKSDTIPAFLTEFYENGQASVRTYILNKVQHGQTYYYHENGELSSEGMFEHGDRVGKWNYYDDEGQFLASETFVLEFNTTCGYKIDFPNDRWIYMSEDNHGDKVKNTSLDIFYRKGVYDKKGGELPFAMYTACLHKVPTDRVSHKTVGKIFLKNKGVKYKEVKEYKGITFDFSGSIYLYTDTDFDQKVTALLFMDQQGTNVMELIFHFDKKVSLEELEDIKEIVNSLRW